MTHAVIPKCANLDLNVFKALDKFEISGGGVVYTGYAPFSFDKDSLTDMAAIYDRPWAILHPDTEGKLQRCTGLETHSINRIKQGAPIGLRVVEWKDRP